MNDHEVDDANCLIVETTLKPAEIALARLGRFLHGRLMTIWIATSALLAIVWGIFRARGHAVATEVMLPLLLLSLATPIFAVLTGMQSKSSKAAMIEGVRFTLDATEVRIELGKATHAHRWDDVDDAFVLGNVVVLVVGGAVFPLPIRALGTRARLSTLRSFLRAWSREKRRG